MSAPHDDCDDRATADAFREFAEWDWLAQDDGDWFLHWLPAPHVADPEWHAEGMSACGMSGDWFIPSMGARIRAPRCAVCCYAAGLPVGLGSPKNDDGCRPLVKARLERLGLG